MHFKTHHKETAPRSSRDLSRPKHVRFDGTLSRRDLQRIVAEILG